MQRQCTYPDLIDPVGLLIGAAAAAAVAESESRAEAWNDLLVELGYNVAFLHNVRTCGERILVAILGTGGGVRRVEGNVIDTLSGKTRIVIKSANQIRRKVQI